MCYCQKAIWGNKVSQCMSVLSLSLGQNGQVKQKLFFLIIVLQNITLDQKTLKWIGIIIIFKEKIFYLKCHKK